MALGHGAGGGFGAADLVAARDAALSAGVTVVTIEQPYKVAGRRVAADREQLDAAWVVAVPVVLEAHGLDGLPLIFGGRSSGARVACRTASAFDRVAGVLCLAFPEHPPGRPEKSRMAELEGVTVPVLVVQGERDPFGRPPEAPGREVVVVPGSALDLEQDAGQGSGRALARARAGLMHYKRVIPCMDVDGGRVVKGTRFIDIRDAGDPVELAAFYDREGADELDLPRHHRDVGQAGDGRRARPARGRRGLRPVHDRRRRARGPRRAGGARRRRRQGLGQLGRGRRGRS